MQPTSYAIQSHEALSGSLCRLGHLGEALAITERALELGSVNRTVRLRQLWLMALTADTGADLDGWIQALELDSSFPRPSDEHVRTLFVLGRWEDALVATEAALEDDPLDRAALCMSALLQARLGREDQACIRLERLEALGGRGVEEFVTVGRVLLGRTA